MAWFVSKAKNQLIHLPSMLTEAIHTAHLHDLFLAVDNANYVMNNMADFFSEIEFKKDGIIVKRANEVLDKAIEFLQQIKGLGLFDSIEKGLFADVKRNKDGGKGYEGVIRKSKEYWNPVEEFLKNELKIKWKKTN